MKKMTSHILIVFCHLIIGLIFISAKFYKEKYKYLGLTPPNLTPKIFAPDFISKTNESEFGSVFNKKGTEFYYGVDVDGKAEIRYTKLADKTWSEPRVLLSSNAFSCNDPFLSPDENKLYFISNKALEGNSTKVDYDIWYIERQENKWNPKMINGGSNINSTFDEYYISFTKDESMYFSSNNDSKDFNIYSSKFKGGAFQKPKLLDNSINTKAYEADVFVSPDESYIIFCSIRKEGYGKGDLYISFKNDAGNWSEAKNMGSVINTAGHELCPFVTLDGKYFFYTSNQDIYWVAVSIINSLKE